MADLAERVAAEFGNMDGVLARIPYGTPLSMLSDLELVGVAALIHSHYNGVENILKQLLKHVGAETPAGAAWHRELLQMAVERGFVSAPLAESLRKYLAFRHFFTHAYAFDSDPEQLQPLADGLRDVDQRFRTEILCWIARA